MLHNQLFFVNLTETPPGESAVITSPSPSEMSRVGGADGLKGRWKMTVLLRRLCHASFLFEVANLPAHRRLRNVEPRGCARHVLFFSGCPTLDTD